jgi:hypothetical protein
MSNVNSPRSKQECVFHPLIHTARFRIFPQDMVAVIRDRR